MIYPWQQSNWSQFLSMRQRQRLPHAILLSGDIGLGKNALAEEMVVSLLCLNQQEAGHACGQCHSCQLFIAGTHPDHIFIQPEEAGKQIKIDQIRELKSKQSLTPNIADYKTVVISPADGMTVSAANSLLKLLEEPQDNTILLLLSSVPHKLPITIRSRCQVMKIIPPDRPQALDWLQQQANISQRDDWNSLLDITNNAPLAAVQVAETGVEWIQQIDTDFRHLIEGRWNPVEMASRWQNFDLIKVLQQLQRWTQQQISDGLIGEKSGSRRSQVSLHWQLADCILSTIKLISSQNNFNKTLLIEDFMVSVKQIFAAKSSS